VPLQSPSAPMNEQPYHTSSNATWNQWSCLFLLISLLPAVCTSVRLLKCPSTQLLLTTVDGHRQTRERKINRLHHLAPLVHLLEQGRAVAYGAKHSLVGAAVGGIEALTANTYSRKLQSATRAAHLGLSDEKCSVFLLFNYGLRSKALAA
jgi:hypothetical protein